MSTSKITAPVVGFNHNLKHGGRVFHVQTEDSGLPRAHFITHLYIGGNILASMKGSYVDKLDDPEMLQLVRKMMEEQHKNMVRRLVAGEFTETAAKFSQHYEPGVLADGHTGPAAVNVEGASPSDAAAVARLPQTPAAPPAPTAASPAPAPIALPAAANPAPAAMSAAVMPPAAPSAPVPIAAAGPRAAFSPVTATASKAVDAISAAFAAAEQSISAHQSPPSPRPSQSAPVSPAKAPPRAPPVLAPSVAPAAPTRTSHNLGDTLPGPSPMFVAPSSAGGTRRGAQAPGAFAGSAGVTREPGSPEDKAVGTQNIGTQNVGAQNIGAPNIGAPIHSPPVMTPGAPAARRPPPGQPRPPGPPPRAPSLAADEEPLLVEIDPLTSVPLSELPSSANSSGPARLPGAPLPSTTRVSPGAPRPILPPRLAPIAPPTLVPRHSAPLPASAVIATPAPKLPDIPMSIFAAEDRPAQPSDDEIPTLFAEELISERSLDEVILAFLSSGDAEKPK